MQGIFDFGDGIVDWSRDVDAAFERLADLDTPHRWLRANPELGQWLITARHALQTGAPLPDPGDVVAHGPAERQEQLRVCRRLARKENAQVVAVHGYDNQAHAFAKQLRGQYISIEEMACRSLMTAAAALDAAQATQRPLVLLDFLAEGTSNTSRYLRPARHRYEQGQLATARSDSVHRPAVDALNAVAHTSEPEQILYAIDTVLRLPDVYMHRRELIREMRRTLRYKADNPGDSFEDAAWRVRDVTRRAGRRLPRLIVGRSFLVKGLEFDHVVVLDADVLTTPQQMYVAITRGARSLTLLGELRKHAPALS